jgi:hypothetical protein
MNENQEACPYCGRYTCGGCESAGETTVESHWVDKLRREFEKYPANVGPDEVPEPGLKGIKISIPKVLSEIEYERRLQLQHQSQQEFDCVIQGSWDEEHNDDPKFLESFFADLVSGGLPAARFSIRLPGEELSRIEMAGSYNPGTRALVYLVSETGVEAIISVDLDNMNKITSVSQSLQDSIKEVVKHLGFAISTGKYRYVISYTG